MLILANRLLMNKKLIYLISFVLIIIGGILPLPQTAKLYSVMIGIGLLYIIYLKESTEWANTIPKMVLWMLIAPVLITLILIGSLSLFWTSITYDVPFSIAFIIFFILIWTLAVYKFEKNKIKVALSIVNALTLTVLALSFIPNISNNTFTILDKSVIDEITQEGYTIGVVIEILIKILTLPYLLGGIWGNVALELREVKERALDYRKETNDA